MAVLYLIHQIRYRYHGRNFQSTGQNRAVGSLTTKLSHNTGYILRLDSCCHGWGKILCYQNGSCREGCDIHALHAKQLPLHTSLDIPHVSCSLLHQFVIHRREQIRVGGADLLNGIFRTDALPGNSRLNLSSQHRIHQKHHVALHNLCFLLPYSGREICRKLLRFLKSQVERALKTLHLCCRVTDSLPFDHQFFFFYDHSVPNADTRRSVSTL